MPSATAGLFELHNMRREAVLPEKIASHSLRRGRKLSAAINTVIIARARGRKMIGMVPEPPYQ